MFGPENFIRITPELDSIFLFSFESGNCWPHLYIYNTLILSVCLTGYRLGSWRSYRHKAGIVRTSMTRGCATRKQFSRKVTSGRITEKIQRQLCIILQVFYYNLLYFNKIYCSICQNYVQNNRAADQNNYNYLIHIIQKIHEYRL
jgi:hypothetical protein